MQIQRKVVRYTHDAIIDEILANPGVSQNELMALFGYRSPASISIIVNSDAFKHRLAQRKAEIVDPLLTATIEDKLSAVVARSAERFLERLEMNGVVTNKELLTAMSVGGQTLGMGAKAPQVQNNLYVIPAPPKVETTKEWVETVDAHLVERK